MTNEINPFLDKNISANFLPRFYRTDTNKKFLQATVDQLIQPGTVQKINGFIGQQNSKATKSNDVFIESTSTTRQNYQLEPSLVIKDELNNTKFFKDYQDYINQLEILGANVSNHARLNNQEFYSWNPHICWDKFVNFQNYYWIPDDNETIDLTSKKPILYSIQVQDATVQDIEGNKQYFLNSINQNISNGMKLNINENLYFVEGVGDAIKLIPIKNLQLYNKNLDIDLANPTVNNIVYIVINRANQTYNQWSRYNRWFHKDVIELAAKIKNRTVDLSQLYRASRPIIEFNSQLQLFNYGTKFVEDVDLYDDFTINPLDIQNKLGYYIDEVNLVDAINSSTNGTVRVLFKHTNKIYNFILINELLVITSVEIPEENQVVIVKQGKIYSDLVFWYTVNNEQQLYWKLAQCKTPITNSNQQDKNQAPLFDVFSYDNNGNLVSLSDTTIFNSTTFAGTKIFSYKINSTGIEDPILKLKLSYRNIENSGDIVFNFDFETDSFSYKENSLDQTKSINFGFLRKNLPTGNAYVNCWTRSQVDRVQPAIRIYKNFNLSISEEDKLATRYNATRVYYPGDIVREVDNNLYQIKTDGSVLKTGISGIGPLDTGAQSVWNFYSNSSLILNNFDLDIFDDQNDLLDLIVQVYVNARRIPEYKWRLENGLVYKKIVLDESIEYDDILTIKAFAKQPINTNGYYQVPINLQQNPTNQLIKELTYGEILDHSQSMIDNFSLYYPEINKSINHTSNLRDLNEITAYGSKFVQHSGPLSLSLYHFTTETNNIIRAIEQNIEDYTKFKRNFITVAENLGVDTDIVSQVNLVLQELNKNKPNTFAYYLSDMLAYRSYRRNDFTVIDYRIKTYPLTFDTTVEPFDLTYLSNRAVYVYLNGVQLYYGKDYTFDSQGFVKITTEIANGDNISVYEYDTTDGSFIPETPTKLGLWPKYEPNIYVDTTLVTPRVMIQGHDGSLTLAYNDYRDELLLELEKRIYNNIKVKYDPTIFNIYDFIPSYNRSTAYTVDEFNQILALQFYKWVNFVGYDFSKPLNFDENNQFTFNYKNFTALDGRSVPGYWRGIYQWMLDTDRPHLCPWEMLGFSEEPLWWSAKYGTAPYTSQNILMWTDISLGLIKEPNAVEIQNEKFAKPFLLDHLPVDNAGNLISPLEAGLINGNAIIDSSAEFRFGDNGPVEAAWRRSSYYPFSILIAVLLAHPAQAFGLLFDRSRIVRNIDDQLIYANTGLRITPSSLILPSTVIDSIRYQTSGIVNYLINYIVDNKTKSLEDYQYDIANMQYQLSYRIGGFTSKEKFNLLLDNKSPLAVESVFVPKEDYDIFLNSSSPIKKIVYSGVIITKLLDGFEIKGYIRSQPYFKYYQWTQSGTTINVGGISESYLIWAPNELYSLGKIVEYNTKFYRTKINHNSGSTFNLDYYQQLPSLPVIGGKEATLRTAWDKNEPIVLPYGAKLNSIQQVVDFLLGYGEWLKDQGFIFDQFNNNINQVLNWETSAKEFLFWTTQNWSSGQDKWDDWNSDSDVQYGSIVRCNGDYYRAERNVPKSIDGLPVYPYENDQYSNDGIQYYEKLNGLSTIGSTVISLSPAALEVVFDAPTSVVNDIRNQFYEYEILSVNGLPIAPESLNFYREGNIFSYSTKTDEGIYGATFYLVQKEQVVAINNNTIFNDLIYNPITGYKQNRIKVIGYVSVNWDGSFNAPGFILDQAKIRDWTSWTDYALGDMVKYKEFYYSANSFIPGSFDFAQNKWTQLNKTPTSKLIPNWTYKAAQFTDFHNLDSDNFDSDQQRMAQHLIGYQKRQYLDNIIKDDVSEFKFYQGMIIEKGTQNVFNKLFDALSVDEQDSIEFYEEWALRVGRYGASSAYESIEFILNEDQFKSNPQGFELVNNRDPSVIDFVIRQTPTDVYLKPKEYNSNPFPISKKYKSFFRSAGSVQEDDVQFIFKDISEIANQDITKFTNGTYVWCTFAGPSWNVYKFVVNNYILDIEYNNNYYHTITLMIPSNLTVGDYIGLFDLSQGNGFYKIEEIVSPISFKIRTEKNEIFKLPFEDINKAKFAELVEQRISYFDSLAEKETAIKIYTKRLAKNNLLWVEGDITTPWSTWTYNPVYKKDIVWNYNYTQTTNFGNVIAVDKQGLTLVVANKSGKLFIYNRDNVNFRWILKDTIDVTTASQLSGLIDRSSYYKVLAMSDDGRWIAASAPSIKNSKLRLVDGLYVTATNGNITSKSQGLVFLYEKTTTSYQLKHVIASPFCQDNATSNEQFGFSLAFGNNKLFIGAIGYKTTTNTGIVYSLTYANNKWSYGTNYIGDVGFYNFGYKIASNSTDSLLAISAINPGVVNFYDPDNTTPLLRIKNPNIDEIEFFGTGLAIAPFDNYIAISATYKSSKQGIVYVYSFDVDNNTAIQEQQFTRLLYTEIPGFGDKIAFIENYNVDVENNNTLIIYDSYNMMGYDIPSYDTVLYDNELYPYELNGFGLVNIYDRYFNKWVLSETVGTVAEGAFNIKYGDGFDVSKNSIIIGAPGAANYQYTGSGQVYEYRNKSTKNALSWTVKSQEQLNVDAYKIKRAFLYNKTQDKLIEYLDVIDCFQGKVPGIADQEIKYKTYYDPAIYNDVSNLFTDTVNSTVINDNVVTVDNGRSWGKTQVGTLWWDLKTTKFVSVYQRDVIYRNGFQNTLATGASVDIYEWVESKYKPSDWDNLADTEEGYSLGISGTSLYGDDAYCVVRKYDNISQSYKSLYYYWVKNKKTAPIIVDRKLSSYDIANLISNPRGQNYRYLTITGTNSFSIVNVEKLLLSTDIILAIEYWTTDQTDQNIHSEWKLISNEITSQIPKNIEQKWFDSLVGRDQRGLPMPDLSLSKKVMYGVENRPRQSMFINRYEALKQIIEHANIVLKKYQIVEQRDLSKLNQYDSPPTQYSGVYDFVVDSIDELADISVRNLRTAKINPVILNGRIVDIEIVDPGTGYIGNTPYKNESGDIIGFYGPKIIVTGNGKDATIFSVIDNKGSLINSYVKNNVTVKLDLITNSGQGYDSNTRLTVRNYSVLVNQDSSLQNSWSVYSYNFENKTWNKTLSQSYDVRKYWNTIDWYAEGYNQFTVADYAVEIFNDLNLVDSQIGDIVKVRKTANGNWILLKKFSNIESINWNDKYQVIGIQSGTIQLKEELYNFGEVVGYAGTFYDSAPYDNIILEEIRSVLEALRDDILIDDLRNEYLNLFFIDLRYALSEQHYLDWAFKTSLIKAKHNVGSLNQRITYKNDNLENFEDYIAEVKPYRTKIREYVSCYSQIDNSNIGLSDFDLPVVFENQKTTPIATFIQNNEIQTSHDELMNSYPWKDWYNNCKPLLVEIKVLDQGQGYNSNTTNVIVSGPCEDTATAEAIIDNGKIVAIDVINSGKGYYFRPTITIESNTGTNARAIAVIGSKVRSPLISMKFDRIEPYTKFNQLIEIEKFDISDTANDDNLAVFKLKYMPSTVLGECIVFVNDNEILYNSYTIEKVNVVKDKIYTVPSGLLTIRNSDTGQVLVLSEQDQIRVEYYRNQTVLSAVDRIMHYYEPAIGSLGKDITQLLTGSEFGGVTLSGSDLVVDYGWDSLPFYSNKWDSFDQQFNNTIITVTATDQYTLTLPNIPPSNEIFNVYYVKKFTTSINADGSSLIYNFDKTIKNLKVSTTYVTTTSLETSATSDTLYVTDTANVNIGDTISSVEKITGIVSETNSVDQTLTIDDATKLSLGDIITFNGTVFGRISDKVIYYVNSIDIDANKITLRTVKNLPESQITNLITKTGIMNYTIGDYFVYNSVVVDKTSTTVKLNYPVIKTVPDNIPIKFTRALLEPTDIKVYNNGVFVLTNTVPVNTTIHVEGYYKEIRLDNNKFGTSWEVISTSEVDNLLTTSSNFDIQIGTPVVFTGTVYGNILTNKVYFVHSIVSDSSFRITSTINGAAESLITASGSMSLELFMDSWISDGNTNIIDIPNILPLAIGDLYVVRNSTSDGAIDVYELDYDTALDGGNINYTTATGIDPTSIIVDGVNTAIAGAPSLEEVVPGNTVDAVAIKVYEKSTIDNSYAAIKVDTYVANGRYKTFSVSQKPNSPSALFVKMSKVVKAIRLTAIDIELSSGSFINTEDNIGKILTIDQNFNIISYESDNEFAIGDVIKVDDVIVGTVLENFTNVQYEIKTLNVDYKFNSRKNTVTFTEIPPINSVISIFTIGLSNNIIEIDHVIADGISQEFNTKIPYSAISYDAPVAPIVYVNDTVVTPEFEQTSTGELSVKFSEPITVNSLITVIIAKTDNMVITTTEQFVGNSGYDYYLSYSSGTFLPYETNMIVRVDQEILPAQKVVRFTITNDPISGAAKVFYHFNAADFAIGSITDLSVIIEGNTLIKDVDYFVNDYTSQVPVIRISFDIYTQYFGKTFTVVPVTENYEYVYTPSINGQPPKISFNQAYSSNNKIEVTVSYKHEILAIQRSLISTVPAITLTANSVIYHQYTSTGSGLIKLNRTVLNENYVWLTQNRKLLTPIIDYKLNEDRNSIQLSHPVEPNTVFDLITYDSNLSNNIAYMQFKDMLNRTHFKRLNQNKQSRLAKDLNFDDLTIEVENASNFDIPNRYENKPGVVDIHGERIEYFSISGNSLGHLRRGTLGTGIATVYAAGTPVQDIGPSETIPYNDSILVDKLLYTDSNIITLSTINNIVANDIIYKNEIVGDNEQLKLELAKNTIEVFVSNYDVIEWVANKQYIIGNLITTNGYTYKCILSHTSSNLFVNDINNWQLFNASTQLNKNSYAMHYINKAPDSPEGDIDFDADFSVDNSNNIELTNRLPFGTAIIVNQKTGIDWDGITSIQEAINDDSSVIKQKINRIARFITAVPGSSLI